MRLLLLISLLTNIFFGGLYADCINADRCHGDSCIVRCTYNRADLKGKKLCSYCGCTADEHNDINDNDHHKQYELKKLHKMQ